MVHLTPFEDLIVQAERNKVRLFFQLDFATNTTVLKAKGYAPHAVHDFLSCIKGWSMDGDNKLYPIWPGGVEVKRRNTKGEIHD